MHVRNTYFLIALIEKCVSYMLKEHTTLLNIGLKEFLQTKPVCKKFIHQNNFLKKKLSKTHYQTIFIYLFSLFSPRKLEYD
jgi:hypothetical protein